MAQAKVGTLEHLWCCFLLGELTVPDLLHVLFILLVSFDPEHGLPCSQQNPMGLLLDYSSDNDDEESPGESTRSSNISKVQYTGPTLVAWINCFHSCFLWIV